MNMTQVAERAQVLPQTVETVETPGTVETSPFVDKVFGIDLIAQYQSLHEHPEIQAHLLRTHPQLIAVCDKPPLLIGGLNSQGQHIIGYDWITVNTTTQDLQPVQDILNQFFPGIFDFENNHPGRGKNGYLCGHSSTLGIFVSWTPADSAEGINPGHLSLSISGGALATLTFKQKFELLVAFHDLRMKCSRIDLKVRDFDKFITPAELEHLSEQRTDHGSSCIGFRNFSRVRSHKNGEDSSTLYGGSRKSDKMLRVYDANEKHKVDAIDWEMECKGDFAHNTFHGIACVHRAIGSVEETAKLSAAMLFGQYNFVERTDKNVSRCKPLEWWEKLKNGIESVKLCTQKVKSTLETTKKWAKDSLPQSMVMVMAAEFGISAKVLKENGVEWFVNEFKPEIEKYLLNFVALAELKPRHFDKLTAHNYACPSSDEDNIEWFYDEYLPTMRATS